MSKTNAARMLDRAGIHYELREYQVDENDLSAPHVAAAIGMPPEQVFKTLVARGDRTGVLLACIPANSELDLKALAAASGNKKVELVAMKEVLAADGLHSRRCFAGRYAQTVPAVSRRNRRSVGHRLGERRTARLPTAAGARRPGPSRRRRTLRYRHLGKLSSARTGPVPRRDSEFPRSWKLG